jgi:hypothetical protein
MIDDRIKSLQNTIDSLQCAINSINVCNDYKRRSIKSLQHTIDIKNNTIKGLQGTDKMLISFNKQLEKIIDDYVSGSKNGFDCYAGA